MKTHNRNYISPWIVGLTTPVIILVLMFAGWVYDI
ncbi:hypothetical protein VPHPS15B6_0028 [Vibrio phage PS15B-6]